MECQEVFLALPKRLELLAFPSVAERSNPTELRKHLVEGSARFELAPQGFAVPHISHFATIPMAPVEGIEPSSKVLETLVLPLHYTDIKLVPTGRIELP